MEVGERVVVRFRLPEPGSLGPHLSDALGAILNISATAVVIVTRRGAVQMPREAIVSTKRVPLPPKRRGHSTES